MATYTKVLLSGSTNGRQIKITTTGTAGTLIHTAVTGTTNLDEIWLWANNTDSDVVKLTTEWGGTSSPDDISEVDLPSESGFILISPGFLLQNGLVVRAFGSVENVIQINGFVNRIVT